MRASILSTSSCTQVRWFAGDGAPMLRDLEGTRMDFEIGCGSSRVE